MGHKTIALCALVVLLVAGVTGVSARATDAGSTPNINIPPAQINSQVNPLPSWEQVNVNGFGDPMEQEVSALEAFNGYLYAGTYNVVDPLVVFDGTRIFRSSDGVTWIPITQPGFQNPHDTAAPAILDFVIFGNRLYASTGRGGNPGQIWRSSSTGLTWAPMVTAGFGDPEIHDIAALTVFGGWIYAGASSQVSGARIYRSTSGDSNTWNPVSPAAPTMAGAGVTGFAVFNNALYATIESEAPLQIWRSTGGAWTSVMNNGFGDSNTVRTGGMAAFGGHLYVGAGNTTMGAQLWRTSNGTTWEQAISAGFGDPNNKTVETVFVFQNQLYASVENAVTGLEIWRSADGTVWEQVNQDGFGDSHNSTSNGSTATANFLNQLYVGTSNVADGGELWRMFQFSASTPTFTATSTATNTAIHTSTYTATATPSNTSTSTGTNTATYTSTVTSTYTATGTQTYTPTFTPSFTSTYTSTSTRTNTPTKTPTYTPTHTPTPLPNIPGKVTGGGTIALPTGKATFGFVVQYQSGAANPSGNLTFVDHGNKVTLKSSSFTLLYINGNYARITGLATVNKVRNVAFTLDVYDYGKSKQADVFAIQIPSRNGYSFGGSISHGNIQISLDQKKGSTLGWTLAGDKLAVRHHR